jgi:deoxyribonuclease-1-like protein
MPAKLILIVLAVAAVGGGGYFYVNFETTVHYAEDGALELIEITPRTAEPNSDSESAATSDGSSARAIAKAGGRTIRIATFNLGRLDDVKLGNRLVADVLVHVIAKFDLVAVQDIHAENRGVLVKLLREINTAGGNFDYAVCPSTTADPVGHYSAFLFNKASVEVDHHTVQSVNDPNNRFSHKPLVGSFRAVGPKKAEAFTFTLVNVHNEPDNAQTELNLLDDVYRKLLEDGRQEDDIILLGDFGSDGNELGELNNVTDLAAAITHTPTTTRGTRLADNILFNRRSTIEFTGLSGVLDMMREHDLTVQQAMAISDHLPVWAEFSRYEGGQPGYVASKSGRTTR